MGCGENVIAVNGIRRCTALEGDKSRQGHHLAAVVPHIDIVQAFLLHAVAGVGLHAHLEGTAQPVEVIDIIGAERALKGLEDGSDAYAHILAALTVQVHVDLR